MDEATDLVMDADMRQSINDLRKDLKRDRNRLFAGTLGLKFVSQPKTHPHPQELWDHRMPALGCESGWFSAGDRLCDIFGPTQDEDDIVHYDVFFDGDNAEACSKYKQHACEADEFWRRGAAQLFEDDGPRIGCEYLILVLFDRNLSAGKLLWSENEQPGHPETKSRIACLGDVYLETERFLSELLNSFDSTSPVLKSPPTSLVDAIEHSADDSGKAKGASSKPQSRIAGRSRKAARAATLVEQAVRNHHKFDGGVVDRTIAPISGRKLASKSDDAFSARSVDRWIKNRFGSKQAYEAACFDGTLGRRLAINGDDIRAFATFDHSENEVIDDDGDGHEQTASRTKSGKKRPGIAKRF